MMKMMTNSPPKIIPRNKTNEIITVAPIVTIKDLPVIIKITIKNPTRSLKKALACGVTVVSFFKKIFQMKSVEIFEFFYQSDFT